MVLNGSELVRFQLTSETAENPSRLWNGITAQFSIFVRVVSVFRGTTERARSKRRA